MCNKRQRHVARESGIERRCRIRLSAGQTRPEQNQRAPSYRGNADHYEKNHSGPEQAARWLGNRHDKSPD